MSPHGIRKYWGNKTSQPHLFIDFDGVINAVAQSVAEAAWTDMTRSKFETTEGYNIPIHYSPHLLSWLQQSLDENLFKGEWLTSWIEESPLWHEQLGFPKMPTATTSDLSHQQLYHGWWKQHVVENFCETHAGQKIIWIDDELDSSLENPNFCGCDMLLIAPIPYRGITPEHLQQIEEFLG